MHEYRLCVVKTLIFIFVVSVLALIRMGVMVNRDHIHDRKVDTIQNIIMVKTSTQKLTCELLFSTKQEVHIVRIH